MKRFIHLITNREKDWLYPLVALLFVVLLATRAPVDTDMWWHLRAGQTTISTGIPMTVDSFSFTRSGTLWLNHSWLSQVIMVSLYQAAGFFGLGLWVVVLAVLGMALVYAQLSGHPIVRIFLIILGCTVTAVVWSPRPQMVSLFMFSFLGFLLHQYKYFSRSTPRFFPLLFLIWGNLHGGYVLGFILVGAIFAGEGINHILRAETPYQMSWPKMRGLALWTILSAFALLINPNGIGIWQIPFQTVNVGILQKFIEEWASPDFHDLNQIPFLALLALILVSFGLAGKKRDGSDIVVVLIFAAMGLVARRNFGPFALAGLPILSRAICDGYQSWRPQRMETSFLEGKIRQPDKKPGWMVAVNLLIVGILAVAGFLKLFSVTYPPFIQSTINGPYPVNAVMWLKENKPAGRMLNEYNWGGYLIWHLPEYPVFVDGRTDLYGDEILEQWINLVQANGDWQMSLDNWQINLVLIIPERPLAGELEKNGWQKRFSDGVSVIYGRIP